MILGNYGPKVECAIAEMIAAGKLRRGELYTCKVSHDDWCRLLASKGACDCSPDVEIKLARTPADLARFARETRT